MSHVLRIGVADQIGYFRAFNDDGTAKTDLTSAAMLTLSVFRVGLAPVSFVSASDKAADNSVHSDGAIRKVGGNLYTIDLPDAATATQTPSIGVRGTFTGGEIEPIPHPIVNYDPSLAAVGANTVTPPAASAIAAETRTELTTELSRIDANISTRSTFAGGAVASVTGAVGSVTSPVTVGTNNDKTGYALTQAFPSNFATLGINASGHVSRVLVVDTTTTNADMRGTDNALLATNYTAPANGEIAAIKAKTDNLPLDPAAVGDVSPTINFSPTIEPTTLDITERGAIATAVRSELATELGRMDAAVSTRSTFAGGAVSSVTGAVGSVTSPVTVGTNNDKTGYALTQVFPSNFALLGINALGHVSQVTLVDTTTTNTDMRGTDSALLASSYSAAPSAAIIADAVWDELQSGHTAPGTFGSFIDASISSVATGGVSAGDIASAVRSELTTELGRIDVAVSSRSTFAGGAVASVTSPVTVGTNNDKTGYALTQAFPSNFASLGINALGHVSQVTLVDTTTANGDMRGTDNANTVTPPTLAQLEARTLPAAEYFDPDTDGVEIVRIDGVPAVASDLAVNFPLSIGTSFLSPFNVQTVLNDYGTAKTSDVTPVDTKVTNLQTRLPAALVSGKIDAHIAPGDRTGYVLDAAYQASLVAAIDAALLDEGDATDLIGAIVARIGNTNVDEAALVAAIKASLFSAGSIANKLEVDGAGRVVVGTNADKSNYMLAADQAVNVTKVGGITVSGPDELKADVSGLSTLTAPQVWSHVNRTLSEFAFPVTVGTNNDKTGYAITQAFPSNFASLGINASGHVSRVTLVDTTTANSDMRGTDSALLASSYSTGPSAAVIADAVWDEAQIGHTTPGTFGSFIDASISSVSTGGVSAGDIASAVRSELTTELGRIDAAISTRSTFAGGAVASVTSPVIVGTNNDKAGYALTQAFPSNFASLGINASGDVSRVSLVDTTTANSDMRGTDNALLASAYSTGPSAATIADAVWDEAQSGHTVPGTFGSYVDASISGVSTGGVSAGDIASAVRSELNTELGRIDATVSSRSTFAGGAVSSVTGAVGSVTSPVTVGTNNDKTGYALTQAFPINFASLGINALGYVNRVTLVDTTTTNADMRGTDNALLATNYTAPANADIAAIKAKTDNLPDNPEGVTAAAIWQHPERTLTSATGDVVIDVEALAAGIAGALTTTGLYRLTIDTFDETLQAVPGVQFQIVGVAGTYRTSGSNGRATIDLDPGIYTLRVTAPNGYASVPDREIQIVDADVTQTIDLVSSLPSVVPPPGTCAFTVRVASQAGSNLVGIPVSAKLPKGYVVNVDTLNINLQTSQATDTDGLASLILLRNQPYELVIRRPDGGIVTIRIRTPDAEQATLSQVIEI